MPPKRKRPKKVLEDQVLKIRKAYDEGIDCSEEYSIIWKIPITIQLCDCLGSFIINHNRSPIAFLKFQCCLEKSHIRDYYNVLIELHGNLYTSYPIDLSKNMHISVSLMDKNKRIGNTHKKVIKSIHRQVSNIIFENFIKVSDLLDENNSFFSNEKLTIYCKIYNGEERNTTEEILLDDDSSADCQLKVLDNFEQLLLSEKFSDMKFIIGSKELKVHKYILSAQSPVFEAMFKHDTQEQRNNSVKIIDINYETMKEVLRFIYAGKVNNIKKLAKDIFVAAEKYEIDALKKMCENNLIESLSVKNISDMLKLVDRYDSENLKKSIFNFISDNKKNVNNTKDFHETLDTLSNNLLKEIVKIFMSRE